MEAVRQGNSLKSKTILYRLDKRALCFCLSLVFEILISQTRASFQWGHMCETCELVFVIARAMMYKIIR